MGRKNGNDPPRDRYGLFQVENTGYSDGEKSGVSYRIYYWIDESNLIGCLGQTRMADCANSEVTCPPSCNGEIRRPIITEKTQGSLKTTTETTSTKSELGLAGRVNDEQFHVDSQTYPRSHHAKVVGKE
ncbi:hypothetical protein [Vibrio aestuarianus]|uniref:hypothetical protein n=1 Tax=Vibrio aestuarianus TaxID=28171 RepID=UPI00237D1FDD|nr:hypothetical protein [Vibrio aestuarianus]MDE1272471.1 hypothetical protein [Vibrio aestuarianus]MDE1291962.1 hypothetical protein [Vibrio aestuarianus]MDE1306692.1 hypothetical protein [Vibrio aestuarianus]MDH6001348.1 hypothetical protein [Vibrio aestuarianus]